MMITAIFYCFLVICVAGKIVNANADDEYCQLSCSEGSHTVCDREEEKCGPDPKCGQDFREIKLRDDQRQAILDLHNELRNKVALGQEGNQPPASDMKTLSYNKELEFIAQCWTNECNGDPLQHDECRRISDFEYVGQNLARLSSTSSALEIPKIIKQLIWSWYDEVKDYDPRLVNGKGVWSSRTGHYTQIVWADTSEVGCAVSYYSTKSSGRKWYNVLLACNYGPGGNYLGRPVYRKGQPATKCRGRRINKKYRGLCGEGKSLEKTPGFKNNFFNVTL